jgi:trk system potassium uptake protein TrkH
MRWRLILHVAGLLVLCIGLTMYFPVLFAFWYRDGSLVPILKASGISLGLGMTLCLVFRKPEAITLSHREAMAIVTLSWVAAGALGALPFLFAGTFSSFVDAFFESVSGFTTTGASVLTNIEAVPKGILMWRSLTHWLGGMGIIVLSLAVLPLLGVGGMQLYKAEVPSPVPDKLTPRIRDTALLLWKVYLLFSLVETLLLIVGGLDLFEALCHTFGTMATGGFSTRNASIGHYQSVYIDVVIIVFMLVAGVNFSLHYRWLHGNFRAPWRDPEFRFFLGVVLALVVVSTVSLFGSVYQRLDEALRHGAFQVVSIITTTGFVTADYERWTPLAQAILLFCMFLGASAGSTGGGIKCVRVMLLVKHCGQELFRLIHPRAVTQVKSGGRLVPAEVMTSIWGFFFLYLGLFLLAFFLVTATGVDMVTSFAAVAATIGNIGPGLGAVGPTENYAHLPVLAKWILTMCMILGRLEIYTVIVLLIPEFWRK